MHRHVNIRALVGSAVVLVPLLLSACSGDDDDSASTGGDSDVAAGKAAVDKYVCKSCHGDNLAGSMTPVAGTMAAYAANLTPDKDTGLGEWDAKTIKTAILTGVDDEGEQLCSTMPVFKDMKMTDAEADSIVAYLKSLPAVMQENPESECAGRGDDSDEPERWTKAPPASNRAGVRGAVHETAPLQQLELPGLHDVTDGAHALEIEQEALQVQPAGVAADAHARLRPRGGTALRSRAGSCRWHRRPRASRAVSRRPPRSPRSSALARARSGATHARPWLETPCR